MILKVFLLLSWLSNNCSNWYFYYKSRPLDLNGFYWSTLSIDQKKICLHIGFLWKLSLFAKLKQIFVGPKKNTFYNQNPDETESFQYSFYRDPRGLCSSKKKLVKTFGLHEYKNPPDSLSVALSRHQSASLFFSFYFQSQAPTQ